jgi:hypothetical protein
MSSRKTDGWECPLSTVDITEKKPDAFRTGLL